MKENKINWWLIIGIVVVVAVITALVTLQVTGNVVSVVNTDKTNCVTACRADCSANNSLTATLRNKCRSACSASCSKVDVYTKAEVDALLANVGGSSGSGITKQEVLDILNSCKHYQTNTNENCNERCTSYNLTCISGELTTFGEDKSYDYNYIGVPTGWDSPSCTEGNEIYPMSCVCC